MTDNGVSWVSLLVPALGVLFGVVIGSRWDGESRSDLRRRLGLAALGVLIAIGIGVAVIAMSGRRLVWP